MIPAPKPQNAVQIPTGSKYNKATIVGLIPDLIKSSNPVVNNVMIKANKYVKNIGNRTEPIREFW